MPDKEVQVTLEMLATAESYVETLAKERGISLIRAEVIGEEGEGPLQDEAAELREADAASSAEERGD